MASKPVIAAIDPGAGGAIAWYDIDGLTHSEYMPDTLEGIVDLVNRIENENFGISWYIEKVGTYMPGNSGPAAVTFARHCGHLDAVLATLNCQVKYITPQKWMKPMPITRPDPYPRIFLPAGCSAAEKKALIKVYDKDKAREMSVRKTTRKNEIKAYVANRFPTIKITLKNADALGLLDWAHQHDTQQELL